ncbi:uncharacterized protein F5891DRAFT_1246449 [Suillus fuscotomentosus]|uniref:Uncharacterized protein n=1 Tax=Suillus fuscotomentosus TaxID=1912939 RepID=A0AAD4HHC2_9AGAM|nr:uncharacterized protein F5891DRAFT_1246449 [Suillus fuscotomentosus]KAG1896517.1 hypothetical protein F5891DRAFT_1246449 [Suillus fuscotomentosus]
MYRHFLIYTALPTTAASIPASPTSSTTKIATLISPAPDLSPLFSPLLSPFSPLLSPFLHPLLFLLSSPLSSPFLFSVLPLCPAAQPSAALLSIEHSSDDSDHRLEKAKNGEEESVDFLLIEKMRPVAGAAYATEKPEEVIHGEETFDVRELPFDTLGYRMSVSLPNPEIFLCNYTHELSHYSDAQHVHLTTSCLADSLYIQLLS